MTNRAGRNRYYTLMAESSEASAEASRLIAEATRIDPWLDAVDRERLALDHDGHVAQYLDTAKRYRAMVRPVAEAA